VDAGKTPPPSRGATRCGLSSRTASRRGRGQRPRPRSSRPSHRRGRRALRTRPLSFSRLTFHVRALGTGLLHRLAPSVLELRGQSRAPGPRWGPGRASAGGLRSSEPEVRRPVRRRKKGVLGAVARPRPSRRENDSSRRSGSPGRQIRLAGRAAGSARGASRPARLPRGSSRCRGPAPGGTRSRRRSSAMTNTSLQPEPRRGRALAWLHGRVLEELPRIARVGETVGVLRRRRSSAVWICARRSPSDGAANDRRRDLPRRRQGDHRGGRTLHGGRVHRGSIVGRASGPPSRARLSLPSSQAVAPRSRTGRRRQEGARKASWDRCLRCLRWATSAAQGPGRIEYTDGPRARRSARRQPPPVSLRAAEACRYDAPARCPRSASCSFHLLAAPLDDASLRRRSRAAPPARGSGSWLRWRLLSPRRRQRGSSRSTSGSRRRRRPSSRIGRSR
jgi:hypothetical protein